MQRKHVRTCRCNIGMEIHLQMYNLFFTMELFNKNKKDTITILKINAPITSLIAC